jgi:hypothetical protein
LYESTPELRMNIVTLVIDMQADDFAHERLARNRASLV